METGRRAALACAAFAIAARQSSRILQACFDRGRSAGENESINPALNLGNAR
jgi:hypothetical protein